MNKMFPLLRIVLLLFILLHQGLNVQAQNGIGILELGKSEEDILTALKIIPTDIIDGSTKTLKFLEKSKKDIIRIKYDPQSPLVKDILEGKFNDLDLKMDFLNLQKCKDAVTYLIPKCEIYGTSLEEFRLLFFKDQLIQITTRCERNKAFLAVFESKFGQGETSYETDDDHNMKYTIWGLFNTPEKYVVAMLSDGTRTTDLGIGGTVTNRSYDFLIRDAVKWADLVKCNESGEIK